MSTSYGSLNPVSDYLPNEDQDIGFAKRLREVVEFVLNEFESALFSKC